MATRRKQKKSSAAWRILALSVLTIALAVGGYYYFSQDDSQKLPIPTQPKQEQKTEQNSSSKAKADYKKQTLQVQSVVEKSLKTQGLKIQVQKNSEQDIERDNNKGTINWWQRQIVIVPDKDINIKTIQDKLNADLKGQKAKILRTEQDTYNDKPAQRIDVAYTDELGGDQLNLVVDKIYLINPQDQQTTKTKRLGSGKLAIVIDDCGYDTDTVRKMTALKQNLTFAVIPYREYSTQALNIIKNSGKQAILHLPMQPLDKAQQSEQITIETDLTDQQIKDITQKAINQLPGIVGVNNHQGSKATADERVMRAALSTIKANDLFFLDSNTQPNTVAHKIARQMGIDTGLNKAFLDGQASVPYIKSRMRQAGQAAIKQGSYIAICHARPATATALEQMVGELEDMGVQFVFVSNLLN